MTDQQKRNTLKMMAAAGATAAVPGVLHAREVLTNASVPQPVNAQIQIDVLACSSLPGDRVILQNTSGRTLAIDSFRPGIIVYGNSMLDLNELHAADSLVLKPEQKIVKTVARWQLLSSPTLTEYLLADDFAQTVSVDTEKLKLVATIVDGQAVVAPAVPRDSELQVRHFL